MSAESPYEVRCLHCNTSFAPETTVCVHCGRPLRGGLAGLLAGTQQRVGESMEPLGEPDDDELDDVQVRGRNLVWVGMAIMMAVLSALRSCAG